MASELVEGQDAPEIVPDAPQLRGGVKLPGKGLDLPGELVATPGSGRHPIHFRVIHEIETRPDILMANDDQMEVRTPARREFPDTNPANEARIQEMSRQGVQPPIGLRQGQVFGKSEGQKPYPIQPVFLDHEPDVFIDTKGILALIRGQFGGLIG
jgi:hypothetical protein